MGAPKKKYKRSWRNLLLDRSYQLKFTLFMVGLCAILMGLLGWWVMRVAHKATTVAKQNIPVCAEPPSISSEPVMRMPIAPAGTDEKRPDNKAPAPAPDDAKKPGDTGGTKPAVDEKKPAKAPGDDAKKPAKAPGDDAKKVADGGDDEAPDPDDAVPERPRVTVTLDDIPDQPVAPTRTLPDNYVARTIEFYTCRLNAAATARELADGQRLILIVLLIVGLMLTIGIAMYGIKMTHKVAGPLFKVQLYLAKMKKGRYDTVWNLRKGDQLIDFYAHFKDAHAGLRKMEEQDVERLRAIVEAADKADLASKSPEIKAALEEMRTTLARKEEGLE